MESRVLYYSSIVILLSLLVFDGCAVGDIAIEGQSICTDLTVSSVASAAANCIAANADLALSGDCTFMLDGIAPCISTACHGNQFAEFTSSVNSKYDCGSGFDTPATTTDSFGVTSTTQPNPGTGVNISGLPRTATRSSPATTSTPSASASAAAAKPTSTTASAFAHETVVPIMAAALAICIGFGIVV